MARSPPERCLCKGALCQYEEWCVISKDQGSCLLSCVNFFPKLVTKPCLCNTHVCSPGQACDHPKSSCWTPPACPALPQAAGPEGCTCGGKSSACIAGQVCAVLGQGTVLECRTMPSACTHGLVQDSAGCYCKAGNSLCSEGQQCSQDSSSCIVPQLCPHPATLSLNISTQGLTRDQVFIAGDTVTLTCAQYHSLYQIQVTSLELVISIQFSCLG